jgi:hypothetical protein
MSYIKKLSKGTVITETGKEKPKRGVPQGSILSP